MPGSFESVSPRFLAAFCESVLVENGDGLGLFVFASFDGAADYDDAFVSASAPGVGDAAA